MLRMTPLHRAVMLLLVSLACATWIACGESKKKPPEADKSAAKKPSKKKAEGDKGKKKASDDNQDTKRPSALKTLEDRKEARAKKLSERRAKLKARRDARRKEMVEKKASAFSRKPATAEKTSAKDAKLGPVRTKPTPAMPVPTARVAAPPAPAPVVDALPIEHLLSLREARKMSETKRLTRMGPVVGIEPGERYNSFYFAPPKRSQFGIAVQVWKERTIGSVNERFNLMKRDYPNTNDTREVAKGSDREFFSNWNDIMSVTVAGMKKRTVVTISCGTKTCSLKQLYEIARATYSRI